MFVQASQSTAQEVFRRAMKSIVGAMRCQDPRERLLTVERQLGTRRQKLQVRLAIERLAIERME